MHAALGGGFSAFLNCHEYLSYQVFFNKSRKAVNGRVRSFDSPARASPASYAGARPQVCGVLQTATSGKANNNSSSASSRKLTKPSSVA
jgi:hypothetical protein